MDPLQHLLEQNAIQQVYIRYCELIDHDKQFDGMTEVFSQDTRGEYAQYNNVVEGVDTLIAAMHHNLGEGSNCGRTQHNVNNFRIQVDGDRASGKCHFYAVHEGLGRFTGEMYSMWGEYEDEWTRTAQGWRVARRVYHVFLTEGPAGIVSRDAT